MSAFVLEDGVVYHTDSAYARGLDGLWGMYQWLDRAPRGAMRSASGGADATSTRRFLRTPARVATRRCARVNTRACYQTVARDGDKARAAPIRLPHERHQTMPDPFLVFGISGQVLREEAFLVKEPPYQKWHHGGDRDKPPVRAKRQRRAEEV
jgi:hypothetical protein